MNSLDHPKKAKPDKKRRRLSPSDRDAQIVKETIRYIAEVGLDGQTRELAQRLGITQPLLYRYFPTKQHLIDRVYYEVFERSWDPEWRVTLEDRTVPLRERLVTFYRSYTQVIFTYEWMRIYMYSGLAGAKLNRKFIKRLEDEILKTICREIRAEYQTTDDDSRPIDPMELELVWNLQGGIFYYGVRKYIYQISVSNDLDFVIEECVDTMLHGLPRAIGASKDPSA